MIWLATALAGPVSDGADAWDRGQIVEAVEIWTQAEQEGNGSPSLYYDLGNGWYRIGDRGKAIAYWRAAQLISPRNGDVLHNLALVRSELEGVPDPVPAPTSWMSILTVAELGLVALFAMVFASVTAVRTRRRRDSPWPAVAAGAMALLLAALTVHGTWLLESGPLAVVVDGPVIVRDTASADGGQRFVLQPGSEVRVERQLGEFLLVETSDGDRGWVASGGVWRIGPRLRERTTGGLSGVGRSG